MHDVIQQQLQDLDEEYKDQIVFDLAMQLDRATSILEPSKRGRNQVGRKFVQYDRLAAYERLVADYFVDQPVYDVVYFRRRFRMRKELFLHIVDSITLFNPYFEQRVDAIRHMGLSTLKKYATAMKMLAYGGAINATN